MLNYMFAAPVASILFGITIIISLYTLFFDRKLLDTFTLKPYDISRGRGLYAFITSGFIHADITHLLFNMLTFYFFAFYLESVIGHWQFFLLYFSAMILSDIPSVIKNKNNENYASLGASGAISAVVFSFIIYNPLSEIYIMFIPIGIPAFIYAFAYLAYCIFASKKQYDNVNHSAHLWGAIWGVILTLVLDINSLSIFLSKFGL
jgi:membrane associated rhomboid family serine protease